MSLIFAQEMDGKYVGSRPIKLRKSNWKDRNIEQVSAGMWIFINRMRIRIQDDKITNMISNYLSKVKKKIFSNLY